MTGHVLIVEDDRVTRMRLAGYLREQGYRVTEVADAEAMQQVIDTDPPETVSYTHLTLPTSDLA